jgi:hypothetical protein
LVRASCLPHLRSPAARPLCSLMWMKSRALSRRCSCVVFGVNWFCSGLLVALPLLLWS